MVAHGVSHAKRTSNDRAPEGRKKNIHLLSPLRDSSSYRCITTARAVGYHPPPLRG
jgi:hypothetical protein